MRALATAKSGHGVSGVNGVIGVRRQFVIGSGGSGTVVSTSRPGSGIFVTGSTLHFVGSKAKGSPDIIHLYYAGIRDSGIITAAPAKLMSTMILFSSGIASICTPFPACIIKLLLLTPLIV